MLDLFLVALFALVALGLFLTGLDAWLRGRHNRRVLEHRRAGQAILERYIAARREEARWN